MNSSFSIHHLAFRIGLLAVLGLSVAFGAFALLGLRAVEERSFQIQNERLAMARIIAGELDRSLAHALRMLERTAAREEVSLADVGGTPPDGLQPQAVEAWRHALEDAYRLADLPTYRVLLLDRDGRVVLSVPDDPELIRLDLSDQVSVRETLDTGEPTVSNSLPVALLVQPVVALSVPVRNDQGEVAGLLVQTVDLLEPELSDLLRHFQAGETGYAQLVDEDGTVIASTRPQNLLREWEHRPAAASLLTAGQPQAGIYPTPVLSVAEGVEGSEGADLLAFAPLSVVRWGVSVEQEVDEALAPIQRLRRQFLSLGLIALLTALFLVWITTRQVVQPVRELTAAARHIAGGELDRTIVPHGEDEIGQLARAFEEMRTDMQRRTRELSVLHQTALAGAGAGDVDELVARVTEILAADLYPENAGFLFLDPEGERLHLHPSYHGAAPETLDLTLDLGEGVTGTVAQTGEPLLLPDVEAEPGYIEISSAVRSELCVPVRAGGQVVGVINVESVQQDAFSQVDLHLLSAVAGQVGTALERLQLFEEAQRRTTELESLREVSLDITAQLELSGLLRGIVRRAAELLGASGGGLYLYHPEQGELELVVSYNQGADYTGRRLKVDEGLSGRVVATGQPLIVDDYRTWEERLPIYEEAPFGAVIGVPLRWQERILGVINVTDLGKRRPFDENDLHLLEAFARQAAVAIQNARLHEAERRRAQESAALLDIAQVASSTLDLIQMLKQISLRTAQICRTNRCTIFLLDRAGERLEPIMSQFADGRTDPDLWQRFRTTTADQIDKVPFFHQAVRQRQPAKLEDVTRYDLMPRKWTEPFGIRKLLAVPLVSRDRAIGLMVLDHEDPEAHFSQEQVDLAATIAGQVAASIENAQLFEAEQAARRHAETLQEAAAALGATLELEELLDRVLEELQKVVPYDSASVQLLREDHLEIIAGRGFPEPDKVIGLTFPVAGDNPNKDVIARKRPVLVPDAYAAYGAFKEGPHSHIRSWLGAPLLAKDRVIGMIALDCTEVDAFSAEEVDIAMAFANHVAVALENARLYAEAERRADQLRALREASRTLTSDLRLEAVLQRLAETARRLADARYAALVVLDAAGKVAQFHTAGIAEAERQRIGESPQGRGLLGILLRDGVPIRIADLGRDPRATGFPPHHPVMKTFMGVPIVARGKVIGCLYLTEKAAGQPFTQEDEDLVLGLAADAAIAIENARLFGEVERLAATDGLTGLYNVRYFYQALEKELERSRRYGHRCSLIMLDLDDFKKYNDRYGHLAGDDLLRELADLIRSALREADTAARYGGEEFVVILPETNGDQAVALAERLRETVQDHKFVVRETQRLGRITVSLGVATYSRGAQASSRGSARGDVEGLVEAADMALLRAKERKNQVCGAAD